MGIRYETAILFGRLVTESSLYIGATGDREFGAGRDLPIIRSPLDQMPLIPGSSLRGRMRSLLGSGLENRRDDIEAQPDLGVVGALFGAVATRRSIASFWDSSPEAPWVYEHRAAGLPLTEWRSEMAPPREGSRFRRRETVCPGVRFSFRLSLLKAEAAGASVSLSSAVSIILIGLRLLEKQGIGGSTTRGFGRVRFTDIGCVDPEVQELLQAVHAA